MPFDLWYDPCCARAVLAGESVQGKKMPHTAPTALKWSIYLSTPRIVKIQIGESEKGKISHLEELMPCFLLGWLPLILLFILSCILLYWDWLVHSSCAHLSGFTPDPQSVPVEQYLSNSWWKAWLCDGHCHNPCYSAMVINCVFEMINNDHLSIKTDC